MTVRERIVPFAAGDVKFKPGSRYQGPVLDVKADTIGVWWWETSLIFKPNKAVGADVDDMLDMLIQNKVNEIYLYINNISEWTDDKTPREQGDIDERLLAGFIEKCAKYGIRVSALTGDGGRFACCWFDPERGYPETAKFLQTISGYNARVAKNQRFYGIHVDLEPHIEDDRPYYLGQFARYIATLREWCDEKMLEFAMDINAWYNEKDMVTLDGRKINIMQVLASCCHELLIMAYRTDAESQMEISKFQTSIEGFFGFLFRMENFRILFSSKSLLKFYSKI